jgi:hypothetical protein
MGGELLRAVIADTVAILDEIDQEPRAVFAGLI